MGVGVAGQRVGLEVEPCRKGHIDEIFQVVDSRFCPGEMFACMPTYVTTW